MSADPNRIDQVLAWAARSEAKRRREAMGMFLEELDKHGVRLPVDSEDPPPDMLWGPGRAWVIVGRKP